MVLEACGVFAEDGGGGACGAGTGDGGGGVGPGIPQSTGLQSGMPIGLPVSTSLLSKSKC